MFKNSLVSKANPIRNYLLLRIRRAGAEPVRLPSERELASKFKVNRSTVRLAIESITPDAFLRRSNRDGMFTNPDFSTSIPFVVGICRKQGAGYLDSSSSFLLSVAADQLYRRSDLSVDFEFFQLNSETSEDIYDEVKNLFYDAVIFFDFARENMTDLLNRLLGEQYPLIVLDHIDDGSAPIVSNMIAEDASEIGRRRANLLAGLNKRSILYVGARNLTGRVFAETLRKQGIGFADGDLIENISGIPAGIQALLTKKVPDAILSDGPVSRYEAILGVLNSKPEWKKIPLYIQDYPAGRRLKMKFPENRIFTEDIGSSPEALGQELAKRLASMLETGKNVFDSVILKRPYAGTSKI